MKLLRRRFLHRLSAAAGILIMLSGYGAWSQTTRTIKIIVSYAAGGSGDILTRLLAEQIGPAQGSTIIIENRPGAGGIIGAEAVSRAAPDGNTLLIIGPNLVINAHLRKLSYDPLTSFEPICYLAQAPAVIIVNGASPYRTLSDLLTKARTKPGDLTLASFGPTSAVHIGVEMFKRAADVNMTYVPYSGDAPAVTALLGTHVTAVLATYGSVVEQIKTGKLRALATVSAMRIESLPEVPTVSEIIHKDYEVNAYYGVFAPAKTPKQTVSQLAGWFASALQIPEVKVKLIAQGLYPVGICSADFGALIRKQDEEFGLVIREANIKVE